jgi:hypothetical protein
MEKYDDVLKEFWEDYYNHVEPFLDTLNVSFYEKSIQILKPKNN